MRVVFVVLFFVPFFSLCIGMPKREGSNTRFFLRAWQAYRRHCSGCWSAPAGPSRRAARAVGRDQRLRLRQIALRLRPHRRRSSC